LLTNESSFYFFYIVFSFPYSESSILCFLHHLIFFSSISKDNLSDNYNVLSCIFSNVSLFLKITFHKLWFDKFLSISIVHINFSGFYKLKLKFAWDCDWWFCILISVWFYYAFFFDGFEICSSWLRITKLSIFIV